MKSASYQYQSAAQQRTASERIRQALLVAALFACVAQAPAAQASEWQFGGGIAYESRYISEGSNSLDHGGIAVINLGTANESEFGLLSAEVEFITGVSVDFRETEISLGYEKNIGDLAAALSWVRIIEEEDEEKEYDTEFVIGLAYEGWGNVVPDIEYIHSTTADGELLVLTLAGEVEIGNMTLAPYLLADIDYGYVSEDYDGLNHIEVGVEWEVPLSDGFDSTIHASYSMAEENLRREGEDNDYFWVGIAFSL